MSITKEDYHGFKKIIMASMNQISSVDQEIYSIKLNKVDPSPYDLKCYILENSKWLVARKREKLWKH